jgi:transposase-like protein
MRKSEATSKNGTRYRALSKKLFRSGQSIDAVARESGCSTGLVRRWLNEVARSERQGFRAKSAMLQSELSKLRAEVIRLNSERPLVLKTVDQRFDAASGSRRRVSDPRVDPPGTHAAIDDLSVWIRGLS